MAKGKTRLRSIDRKAICEAARNDSRMRQEDLAARFSLGRSTVSKTLKHKEKWLAIEDDSNGAMIVKHRTGKFPEMEEKLAEWLREKAGVDDPISDITIKNRSLEIARDLGLGLGQFKSSLGWIEKFRERYSFKKSVPNDLLTDNEARRRLYTFKSKVPLAVNQRERAKQLERKDNIKQEVTTFDTQPEEGQSGDLIPETSRFFSNDPILSAQETPKASKRQYDCISQTDHIRSSIDTIMAPVHLPQGSLLMHSNERADNLLGHSHNDSEVGIRSATSKVPQKRRKGTTNTQSLGHSKAAMTTTLDLPKRTRDIDFSDGQQLGCQFIAAAQAVRRNEEARSMQEAFHRRYQFQPDAMEQLFLDPIMISSNNAHGIQRAVPHPVHHKNSQPSAARYGSRPEVRWPISNEGINELAQSLSCDHVSPNNDISTDNQDNRRISLEEACESLDIVSSFIFRQPANFNPNDYFVLGNLQGMLNFLAKQGQSLPTSNRIDTSDNPDRGSSNTPQENAFRYVCQ